MTEFGKILHLYRRAGFGLSPDQWLKVAKSTVPKTIKSIFDESEAIHLLPQLDVSFVDLTPAERNVQRDQYLRKSALAILDTRLQWMNNLGNPGVSGLREKMTLFWHGHFACQSRFAHTAVQQNNLLRTHALGNFGDLLRGIAHDPGMLVFLNNDANRKGAINENFGRELLELFTLGIGNYTYSDIVAASRAFTGFNHQEHFKFSLDSYYHDGGEKVFLGRKGNFSGDDIVDILLQQKQTARFIVTKIYKFLVSPQPVASRIEALTEQFFRSKFEIRPLLESIFSAPWFYEPQVVGSLIKSPVELVAGIMRVFNLQFGQAEAYSRFGEALGQQLFSPPNVAGWPGGESWITTFSIFRRLNTPFYLSSQIKGLPPTLLEGIGKPSKDLSAIPLEVSGNFNPLLTSLKKVPYGKLTATLASYLLPVSMPSPLPAMPRFSSRNEESIGKALQLMSIPEYQIT